MSITVTSGFFPVAQLPAAQVVTMDVFVTNFENQPADATVEVYKLVAGQKERVVLENVSVPGNERQVIEVESDVVEGQSVEVVVTLPTDGFIPPATGLAPEVAVKTLFTGDGTTSLLQLVSAGDFVPVSLGETDETAGQSSISS